MDFIPQSFHLLRPLWLLTIIPAILIFVANRHIWANSSRWDKAIDSSLLPHLLAGEEGGRQRWPGYILLISWLLASLSLAGPVWEKLPQPVQKKEDALVIIQDLSLSFYAKDLSPNRLTRARHKLIDLLRIRREGTTALIVYSGDAHVVVPLTDDTKTITAMVPDLSPSIMPSFGSNLPDAVNLALRLFNDGGVRSGKILLVTDGVTDDNVRDVLAILSSKDFILSVLGVGTEDGGPIPLNDGGFMKDEQNNIVVPRLQKSVLQELAQKAGGRYSDIKLDDSDLDYLLAAGPLSEDDARYRQIDREFDQWLEQGHWLVILILPFALLAFRRGWLIVFIMAIIFLAGNEAQALEWQDLWLRKDQQAARAMAGNNPRQAAELFQAPRWRGAAEYRAGNYDGAVAAFGGLNSGDDHYNRGNALARKGQLAEALKAYDQALQQNPEMADAKFNRELVEKLLQQQEQQKGQGEEQESSDQQQNEQNGEQNQDQQPGNQQSDDQQPGNQQSDDQQSAGQDSQNSQQEQQDQKQSAGSEKADRTDQPQEDSSNDPDRAKRGEEREDTPDDEGQSLGKPENEDPGTQDQEGKTALPEDSLSSAEKQALEQWLRQIPDNPGGLLKRKFEYQYRENPNRNPQQNKQIW